MSSSATPDPCWPGSPDRAASAWHTSARSSGRQRSPRGRASRDAARPTRSRSRPRRASLKETRQERHEGAQALSRRDRQGWKCIDECRHALPFRFAPSGLMGRPRSARPGIWARRWARTRAKGYNSPTKKTDSSFRNVRKSRGIQTAANACKTYDRTANLLFVGSIPTGASVGQGLTSFSKVGEEQDRNNTVITP